MTIEEFGKNLEEALGGNFDSKKLTAIFQDEGETSDGMPYGPFTYPSGSTGWVTLDVARNIAKRCDLNLLEI